VRLLSSARFTAISSGSQGGCALSTTKSVYCWGRNDRGQLGNGTRDRWDANIAIDREMTAIASNDQFRSVHAMGDQRCAIRIDGAAVCWGSGTATPTRLGSIIWNTIAPSTGQMFYPLGQGDQRPGVNCGLAAD